MDGDEETLKRFVEKSILLGKRIHEDQSQANIIFKQIKDNTNFDSIITQIKGERFLEECRAFAKAANDWNRTYPEILQEFKEVLNLVINDIASIPGVTIYRSESEVKISFNDKEFIFQFRKDLQRGGGEFFLPDEYAAHLAQKENQAVKEIADILSLDLHLGFFLEYIQQIGNTYQVETISSEIERCSDINSDMLIKNMHTLAEWWLKVGEVLEKIKKLTHDAIEMDKHAAKQLDSFFKEEERKKVRNEQLRIAKSGFLVITKIVLGLVPGTGIVSALLDGRELAKLTKEALNTLK